MFCSGLVLTASVNMESLFYYISIWKNMLNGTNRSAWTSMGLWCSLHRCSFCRRLPQSSTWCTVQNHNCPPDLLFKDSKRPACKYPPILAFIQSLNHFCFTGQKLRYLFNPNTFLQPCICNSPKAFELATLGSVFVCCCRKISHLSQCWVNNSPACTRPTSPRSLCFVFQSNLI